MIRSSHSGAERVEISSFNNAAAVRMLVVTRLADRTRLQRTLTVVQPTKRRWLYDMHVY